MPEFMSTTYYQNTVFEWARAFGIILGVFVCGKILLWVAKNFLRKLTAKTRTKIDDIILDMCEEPFIFATVLFGVWTGLETLSLHKSVESMYSKVFYVLIIINIAWLLVRLLNAMIEEYLVPLIEASESDLDDQLLPIIRKGLNISIWTIGILVALNNAGYDVGAILAGLGIGGLAFALAAQDTVSNLFGGFTIFVDKPFTINDRVKISGFDGMIREIGLRSTRLQTLEGRMVTIPNSAFTDNPVENVSSEPTRKVVLNIGLTYDTDSTGMKKGIEILKKISADHPGLTETPLVSFNAFGDFALGILFIYYINADADILDTQTEVNLAILEQFGAAGLDMAFPTQTVYTLKG